MKTVFLRVLEADDKAAALHAAIKETEAVGGQNRFDVDPRCFSAVPGNPFAYWVGDRLRSVFSTFPQLERGQRAARAGGQTSDDVRYLRSYWEIGANSGMYKWYTYLKGGRATRFYVDQVLVAPWDKSRSTFPGFLGRPGRASEKPSNFDVYFRPGLTWPLRASAFSPQVMPAGCIFTVRSYAIVDERGNLLALLAVLASSLVDYLAKLLLGRFGFPEFVVGVLQQLPVPELGSEDAAALNLLARRAWSLHRSLDTHIETSHAFTLPALMQVEGGTFVARAAGWAEHVRDIHAKLMAIQTEINERCFDLYSIDEADRRTISEGLDGRIEVLLKAHKSDADSDCDGDEEGDFESGVDTSILAAELVSWAVGVAFGRFDMRVATGARTLPVEPEPFEPLPLCSPAMLTGVDGLPVACAPTGYTLTFPEKGILVDDPGQRHDLTATVHSVFDEVFGASADARWNEAATLLDAKDHDLRAWLASSFFEHHLKCYSKSGRKAPIFWQLGHLSGRYSVWLYAHRLTRDSLFQIQNDVMAPKLAYEERQLTSLMQAAGGNPSAKERKDIAAQETFVAELREMLDEVKRVAPLWNPNLDDGVVLTMAPLWRLVPQHKAWQKELKSKWDELAAGQYDWAHIAMHLWPERVVPKCATDRSLAIAHGLEDVFWIEGKDGKWGRRSQPTRAVEEIVNERTSPAVKAALKSLLEAPQNGGMRGRGRRKETASSSAGDE